jgi:protein arginine kinase
MSIGALAERLSASQDGGAVSSAIVASGVRVSRNLDEEFMSRLTGDQGLLLRDRLLEMLGGAVTLRDSLVFRSDQLEMWELDFLRDHCGRIDDRPQADPPPANVFASDPRLSIAVCEVDHLRLACFRDGLQLESAWADLDLLDTALEEHCPYAFSSNFGYLSPLPGLTGTGLKVSILVHLPALAMDDQLHKIIRGLGELEVTVSNFPETIPCLRISNSRCLGRSEMGIIDSLQTIALKLEEFEKRSRERLLNKARGLLEDRVMSAFGQLQHGHLTGEVKALELLSTARLGSVAGVLQETSLQDVQRIWFRLGTGNIQARERRKMTTGEADEYRATMLREWTAGDDNDCRKDNSA